MPDMHISPTLKVIPISPIILDMAIRAQWCRMKT